MEQVQYLKEKLTIREFQHLQIGRLPSLGSYELIILSIVLALVIAFVTAFKPIIYILNGVLLPFYLIGYPKNADYWFWFVMLLLLRQVLKAYVGLDVVVL